MRFAVAGIAAVTLLLVGCATREVAPVTPQTADPTKPQQILDAYDFDGEAQLSGGHLGARIWRSETVPEGAIWPWASVSKQVTAVMIMQAVERGELSLDDEVTDYFNPRYQGGHPLTVRDLLRHRTDYRNPDDSPEARGGGPVAYYGNGLAEPCLNNRTGVLPDGWAYNNCDYMVLGGLLGVLEGGDGSRENAITRFEKMIAGPAGLENTRWLRMAYVDEVHAIEMPYSQTLLGYGAAGSFAGPLSDMMRFDRALLDGKLLSDESLATLWDGKSELGYMALGQWVFDAPLRGCEMPVRIVERRGGIGKYQTRNIILPDLDVAVALATTDGAFEFGEIWTGEGFMHDFLSAIACP